MIELKEDQLAALDAAKQPAVVIDPRTGQEYRLIKEEVYDLVCGLLKPFSIDPNDTEDDDLVRDDI